MHRWRVRYRFLRAGTAVSYQMEDGSTSRTYDGDNEEKRYGGS